MNVSLPPSSVVVRTQRTSVTSAAANLSCPQAGGLRTDTISCICRCHSAACLRRLFSAGRILPGHSAAVAGAVRAQAAVQGVALHEDFQVTEVQAGRLQTADGEWHCFDEALWCTQAAAAGWLSDTGLPVGACQGWAARVPAGLCCWCSSNSCNSTHAAVDLSCWRALGGR